MPSLRSIIALAFGMAMLSVFDAGANIERLDIPLAVRNGSGPIELVCVYNISETENYGLVIKWYHENEQIYQWIPPTKCREIGQIGMVGITIPICTHPHKHVKPQDLGVIADLTSYTPNITDRPQSHSIINVREVTMDMSGEYTCIVSTFYSEDVSEIKTMIVYVPEESLTIRASDFNETHVNLSCSATGARPRPNLTILIDSAVVDNRVGTDDENYTDDPRISLYRVTRKPVEPVVVECEVQIPGTGYGRRERLVYYPNEGGRSPKAEYMNSTEALGLTSGLATKYHADFFGLTLTFLAFDYFCRSV